jgi:predicted Zn-dependent peptidase
MFRKDILNNGIRVVSETIPHVRSVSIGIWVNVGSRHEPPELGGISHVIEHMFFKGTEKRSAQEIAVAIDSIGGEMNAFTSRENTTYYAKVLDEHLPIAVDLLSDVFLYSRLKPEDLDKERKVILEEIKMVEDTPDDLIHDILSQVAWPDHPLGRSILGTKDTVKALTRQHLEEYIARHYHPLEIIISVTGNFEHDALISLLNEKLGQFTRKGDAKEETTPTFQRHVYLKRKELEQVQICLASRGLQVPHEDRYGLSALNTILGSSMSSRLFQEIRETRGLAYSIYSYSSAFRDTGLLVVYAGTDQSTTVEVVRLILHEFTSFKEKGVGEPELKRAKDQMKGSLMLSMESTTNRMSQLARQEIYFGRHFSLDRLLKDIDEVTPEQVQRLANQLFTSDSLCLTILGPLNKRDLPDDLLVC